MGTPEAMYREDGEKVWSCELNSYGKVRKYRGEYQDDCPFRFQGQYHDTETGLYYNRFRYYSPEEGMYLSQDPISIEGDLNIYAYVCNPNSWIDPFGLNASPETAEQFEARISGMPSGERVAAINGKMDKVATRNGWIKNEKLSKINSRTIYTDSEGYHYSVDTQHGRLEKLDSRGQHLGEYNIDLHPTKDADTSKRHNINCG